MKNNPKISVLLLFLLITNAVGVHAQTKTQTAGTTEREMTMSGDFTFASVGDLMIRRPASQLADPDVQEVFNLIRSADLAMGIWRES